jgi:2-polyprenyl-6-hydroxyphenyl methylase/3-demethylubiquinone-9 3-methyltransferase
MSVPAEAPHRLSDEQLRAIYDQCYVDIYDPHAAQRIRRMLPFFDLQGHDVVADFGCGNGVLLELISNRVREYVGVDFSEEFVRAAERRRDARGIRNGTFHCTEMVAFCGRHPNHFDAAFALDFSEHVYDDQFERIFSAIHASLKPGGALYLHTPNAEYFMERLKERGILTQVEGHIGVRNAPEHKRLLARCGFRDVEIRFLPHYLTMASKLHALGFLPVVGRYFRARLLVTARKAPAAIIL